MTQINRYAKRILKQYGKNIKVFENGGKDIRFSWYTKRGCKKITGYQDLEALANGAN